MSGTCCSALVNWRRWTSTGTELDARRLQWYDSRLANTLILVGEYYSKNHLHFRNKCSRQRCRTNWTERVSD